MFARGHYNIIAYVIKEQLEQLKKPKEDSKEHLISQIQIAGLFGTTQSLCKMFERDNPRFNEMTFVKACGFLDENQGGSGSNK